MENSFTTKNLLVKFVYDEVTNAEKLSIEEALEQDWQLRELQNELTLAKRTLPKIEFVPKNQTIQNILRYSNEQTALEPQL